MSKSIKPIPEEETSIKGIATKSVHTENLNNSIDYSGMAQGNMINPMLKMGKNSTSKDILRRVDETDPNDPSVYVKVDDMIFVCNNPVNLPIELEDKKLLLSLMERFSARNTYNESDLTKVDKNRHFDYPVEAFAELIGYTYNETNRRNVLKLMKQSIYHLDSYRLVATEKAIKKANNKKITIEEFKTIPILGGLGFKQITEEDEEQTNLKRPPIKVVRGCITISLSMELAKYLNYAPIAYFPPELKETQNPISFYLGYDFITHYNTNEVVHHYKNGTIRSIRSLLEKCKDLPSYEYVKEHQQRKYFEKIVRPFCIALSELKSFNINFCQKTENKDKEYEIINNLFLDIPNKQFDFFKGYNFENFLDLYLLFTPKNYPELKNRNIPAEK